MLLVHATAILIDDTGVLIRGPSGSGKSDLALRLIDRGARLVADDQTELERVDGRLVARAPAAIAGLLEVRGVGIVRVDRAPSAELGFVVDLVAPQEIERLPAPNLVELLGVRLPLLRMAPFEISAPAKLRLAVVSGKMDIIAPPDRPGK